jgi:hypothetical protein
MMLRASHILSAVFLTFACSFGARAQPSANPSTPVGYPTWDAGASWGLLFTNYRDLKAFDNGDPAANALNVDVGRYFTTHLKADVGVMWSPSHFADVRVVPIDGLPREYYYLEWASLTIRPTSLSTALTYQFRDNELMHPYVSAGVRTIWQALHTERPATRVTLRGVPYAIPAVDERETVVIARPFVAAGCKSYFNQRVFVRSELLVALGPDVYSHTTLRVGAGVDF